jgi:2',3'-cyclic-nucleotide 2'-phosphodiesterase (5'-nucleotidase family)
MAVSERYICLNSPDHEDNQDPFAILTIWTSDMIFFRGTLLFLLLSACLTACNAPRLSGVETRQYALNDSLVGGIDSSVYRAAQPFRAALQEQMAEVVCTSSTVMEKGLPEGALGNFVADVCLEMGNRRLTVENGAPRKKADCVILNNGGLRKPLPQGALVLSDFYEVMPFENQLVVMTCKAGLMKQLCDFIASKGGTPVAGVEFTIDKVSGTADSIRVNGRLLDSTAVYRVMTADYLANGGDQFILFKSADRREDTGLKIRDALIDYAREKGRGGLPVSSKTDGRIRYESR